MSYHADHLAWQQRVAQEFKATSGHLDQQMFQSNGQWFNYPDLINYLKGQNKSTSTAKSINPRLARGFGGNTTQGFIADQFDSSVPNMYPGQAMLSPGDVASRRGNAYDTSSNYSYAPKRKLLFQQQTKRSKTGSKAVSSKAPSQIGPYVADTVSQTASRLQRNKIERFNEEVQSVAGPKSIARSQFSKAKSQIGSRRSDARSRVISQTSSKQQQRKLVEQQPVEEVPLEKIDEIIGVPGENIEQAEMGEELADQVEELPYGGDADDRMTSVSQVKPSPSQVSNMSGRTYISNLQAQLEDEKDARKHLESELEELKRISSEITSQLSQMQKQEALKYGV